MYQRPLTSQELYHHGILGMKWGKRNGPPYPLGVGSHSASERKAGWTKSLDKKSIGGRMSVYKPEEFLKKYNTKTDLKNRKKVLEAFSKETKKIAAKDLNSYRSEMIKRNKNDAKKAEYYKRASSKELSDEIRSRQDMKKALAIGVGVVGTTAAVIIAYRMGAFDHFMRAAKSLPVEQLENSAESIFKESLVKSKEGLDVILDPGTVIHRMEGYANVDITSLTDRGAFVAHKPTDVAVYATFLRDFHGTGERYDTTYKVINSIKAPTVEKAKEIFDNLWDNDKSFKDLLLNNNFYLGTEEQKKFDAYYDAITKLAHPSDPVAKRIISEYKSRGYNAIVDFHDIHDNVGKQPLYLFDPKNVLSKIGEKQLDAEDVERHIKTLLYTEKGKNAPIIRDYLRYVTIEDIEDAIRIQTKDLIKK